jgi:hypothetical protein
MVFFRPARGQAKAHADHWRSTVRASSVVTPKLYDFDEDPAEQVFAANPLQIAALELVGPRTVW